jgi:hypothetical protein
VTAVNDLLREGLSAPFDFLASMMKHEDSQRPMGQKGCPHEEFKLLVNTANKGDSLGDAAGGQ